MTPYTFTYDKQHCNYEIYFNGTVVNRWLISLFVYYHYLKQTTILDGYWGQGMTADDMSCADLIEAAADSTHLDVLAVKVSVPLFEYLAYRVCRSN